VSKGLNHRMAEAHELHIAETFSLRKTRGSGSQWRDQTDVRGHRMDETVAFAFDGKSTRAASTSIKRGDLAKLVEQSDAERPCLAIRFYGNDRLTDFEDWDLLREDDLLELIDRSRRLSRIEAVLDELGNGSNLADIVEHPLYEEDGNELDHLVRFLRAMA
jgi:hypothetical protein